jgi:hypothetical protein
LQAWRLPEVAQCTQVVLWQDVIHESHVKKMQAGQPIQSQEDFLQLQAGFLNAYDVLSIIDIPCFAPVYIHFVQLQHLRR